MSRAWLAGLLAAVCVTATAGRSFGDEAKRAKPQAYIVIAGVGTFDEEKTQIKPRPSAEADAKALYQLFTDAKHLGAPKENVRLLLSKADEQLGALEATHKNVLDAITWATDKAGPDDLLVIALIGQGGGIGERTVFFTTDSTYKTRDKTALAAAEIEAAAEKAKSQRLLALIDINLR